MPRYTTVINVAQTECRHYRRAPLDTLGRHDQNLSSTPNIIPPQSQHTSLDIDQTPVPLTESSTNENDLGTNLNPKPHIKACETCRVSEVSIWNNLQSAPAKFLQEKCVHDPLTGEVGATRLEKSQIPELARKREVQRSLPRVSPKSMTSPNPAADPMLLSLIAGTSATKTAASAFGLEHNTVIQQSPDMTHSTSSKPMSAPSSQRNAQLSNINIEDQHNSNAADYIYPGCSNCGAETWKGNFHVKGRPRCRKCYEYQSKTGRERPIGPEIASLTSAERDGDRNSDDGADEFSATKVTPSLQEKGKNAHPQCGNCQVANGKRLRRWKGTDRRLCDPCYMHLYHHDFDKPTEHRAISNIDSELIQYKGSQGTRADLDRSISPYQTEQGDWVFTNFVYFLIESNKCQTVQCVHCGWERAKNSTREKEHLQKCSKARAFAKDNRAPTSLKLNDAPTNSNQPIPEDFDTEQTQAEGFGVANSLALKVASTLAPESVAPDDILALFCRPVRCSKYAVGDKDKPTSTSTFQTKADSLGPRIILSKVLNKDEKAAAVARMRADGIEIDSAESDSANSSSDSEDDWSDTGNPNITSSINIPVSLVQNGRYEQQPDPRLWTDNEEDCRSLMFDQDAAERKIKRRPDRKANVKARQNGRAPGALLAISDWQTRQQKYKSFHRETHRNLGPSKKGTTTREVADPWMITLKAGFDDHDVEKKEVEVTPHDFLGLPSKLAYDSVGIATLAKARTLAFRDATKTGRVPDSEKFPVGRGG